MLSRAALQRKIDRKMALFTLTSDFAGITCAPIFHTRRVWGWVTTYTLDALNRAVGQAYRDGTRAMFSFDAAGRHSKPSPFVSPELTGRCIPGSVVEYHPLL